MPWIDHVAEVNPFSIVMTLAEIRKGVDALTTSARRTPLHSWLTVEVPRRTAGRILPAHPDRGCCGCHSLRCTSSLTA